MYKRKYWSLKSKRIEMRCMIQETKVIMYIRSVPKVQIRNHQEESTDEIFFQVFLNRSGLTTARPDRVVCWDLFVLFDELDACCCLLGERGCVETGELEETGELGVEAGVVLGDGVELDVAFVAVGTAFVGAESAESGGVESVVVSHVVDGRSWGGGDGDTTAAGCGATGRGSGWVGRCGRRSARSERGTERGRNWFRWRFQTTSSTWTW